MKSPHIFFKKKNNKYKINWIPFNNWIYIIRKNLQRFDPKYNIRKVHDVGPGYIIFNVKI